MRETADQVIAGQFSGLEQVWLIPSRISVSEKLWTVSGRGSRLEGIFPLARTELVMKVAWLVAPSEWQADQFGQVWSATEIKDDARPVIAGRVRDFVKAYGMLSRAEVESIDDYLRMSYTVQMIRNALVNLGRKDKQDRRAVISDLGQRLATLTAGVHMGIGPLLDRTGTLTGLRRGYRFDDLSAAIGYHVATMAVGVTSGESLLLKCGNPNCNREPFFETQRRGVKYCSQACGNAVRQKRHRESDPERRIKP